MKDTILSARIGTSWCAAVALGVAWLAIGPAGCARQEPGAPVAAGAQAASAQAAQTKGDTSMKLTVTSPAFEAGKAIPKKYTGEGRDMSPPLAWSGVPEGTKELALICDDPDAPSRAKPGPEPWVHWVLYKIPAATRELPEGIPPAPKLDKPIVAVQGLNSWPKSGYGGPMPPQRSGPHRYYFKVYALDAPIEPKPQMTKALLLAAMRGHILAEGELMGTYERQ